MVESQKINEFVPDLMKYTHKDYLNSKYMTQLQNGIAKEFGIIAYYIEDIYKQFFINTATWGLSVYEKELGLQSNPGLSYEERREIIKAKLRGAGTATKQMIKNTAEAFSGGEVEIIEHVDGYYIEIYFVGTIGIPKNMKAFESMINEIIPAHLGYRFKFRFATWGMIKDANLTWNDLTTKTWEQFRTINPKGGEQI
ncbi:hypothetical protein CLPU_1c02150 [Gottschalkia purinilytica]|uniref:Phage-like element pbsx protein XkdT n=1 Tax=Gottschalkia purinilytica TaxID=1503 RepID=A0A0L0WF54_GOTPU|nr:putative phage tail protein [Gottschalkia purinilytica]KNF10050.1 hypothetical protein CLPU_1c02150 [Gottschalkia purinilytica]